MWSSIALRYCGEKMLAALQVPSCAPGVLNWGLPVARWGAQSRCYTGQMLVSSSCARYDGHRTSREKLPRLDLLPR